MLIINHCYYNDVAEGLSMTHFQIMKSITGIEKVKPKEQGYFEKAKKLLYVQSININGILFVNLLCIRLYYVCPL